MSLYERDFLEGPTAAEKAEYEALLAASQEDAIRRGVDPRWIPQEVFGHNVPKGVRQFRELFPNFYLDPVEFKDREARLANIATLEAYINDENSNEIGILRLIKHDKLWFIFQGLLDRYFWFTHRAHLFPEFSLPERYRADYLILGKNSSGWHYVFIEFEAPRGNITLQDGKLGEAFRKGIGQLEDWSMHLEGEFGSLSQKFLRHCKQGANLPSEFYKYDSSRIHYMVIAGRRSDFNDATYNICNRHPFHIIHYDNLVDAARDVVNKQRYYD